MFLCDECNQVPLCSRDSKRDVANAWWRSTAKLFQLSCYKSDHRALQPTEAYKLNDELTVTVNARLQVGVHDKAS
jgi:hypothetical protein